MTQRIRRITNNVPQGVIVIVYSYKAEVDDNGRVIDLGEYDTEEEAREALEKWKRGEPIVQKHPLT